MCEHCKPPDQVVRLPRHRPAGHASLYLVSEINSGFYSRMSQAVLSPSCLGDYYMLYVSRQLFWIHFIDNLAAICSQSCQAANDACHAPKKKAFRRTISSSERPSDLLSLGLDQRITPSSRPTRANSSSPRSRSAWLCAAEIMTRMRARPRGTVGKVMAVPNTPSS